MPLCCWTRWLCIGLIGVWRVACCAEATASASSRNEWCANALAIPGAPVTIAAIDRVAPPGLAVSADARAASSELLMSLSLSGGGYRAMLFHVGTLLRLNEAGMLPRLAAISSVSGGTVVSAYLAYRWNDLSFDADDRATNFSDVIEKPLRGLARTTLDIPSVLEGMLPFVSTAQRQASKFDDRLFRGALLSDIAPGGLGAGSARPRPLFIINATNLQTGELWQFRALAMGGPIAGWTGTGSTRLSEAVAASSGFPPFLSPLVLHPAAAADSSQWHDCVDYRDNPYGVAYANEPGRRLPAGDRSAYRQSVHLIDGGVRDNLGIAALEEMNRLRRYQSTARTTVTLISDGGATTKLDADPSSNWAGQSMRVLNLLADQPDEVRVGNIIRSGSARLREFGWNARELQPGCVVQQPPAALQTARRRAATATELDAFAYWSIRRMPKFHLGFECPPTGANWMAQEVSDLSLIPTAFREMPDSLQARLINWGYLAAHHGLPYIDFAWPNPALRAKWLDRCKLPYGPESTDPSGDTPSARDARCLALSAEAAAR